MLWLKLQGFLRSHAPLGIAFSGGLDSRFLAYAAKKTGCRTLLLHAMGPHIPQQESLYAQQWAKQHNLTCKCVHIDVLQVSEVRNNAKERCYFCKKYMLEIFKTMGRDENILLCDGTNADDLQEYRPGLRALKEVDVLSPLAYCGFDKAAIRRIGAEQGLERPEQKARPCLLTRFAYDLEATPELLARLASVEYALEQAGLMDFRLRFCPNPNLYTLPHTLAHSTIANVLKQHGFGDASINITNDISGFFDRSAIT